MKSDPIWKKQWCHDLEQKLIDGLEDNCRRWAEKLHRVYKAGDAMAETCKDHRKRQDWWQEKSRTIYIPSSRARLTEHMIRDRDRRRG